ncbi:hypothetical protein HS1genome_1847 [Sulfodiicoccus acidiphilus]|uniref:Uncharacterized protein n=2 Tax=Sulfodiicoccus acidiphilus TaxID=1670455 RepID=A0A348B5K6_9CREN|nr:hypothetical protein HS1genome_1847 [Sulfodiicoccus acidiphilus]GGT92964.1 hypothetical protein GCM10007116_08490 [Sulfodiicoccus acidiphilus]
MRKMSQVERKAYTVERVEPTTVKFRAEEENVTLRLFAVPVALFSSKSSFTPLVSVVIAVDTDKPRMGEMCDPTKFGSHRAVSPMGLEVQEGWTVLSSNDVEVRLRVEVTNLNVYPELRDGIGNPCVNVSWILLTNVK